MTMLPRAWPPSTWRPCPCVRRRGRGCAGTGGPSVVTLKRAEGDEGGNPTAAVTADEPDRTRTDPPTHHHLVARHTTALCASLVALSTLVQLCSTRLQSLLISVSDDVPPFGQGHQQHVAWTPTSTALRPRPAPDSPCCRHQHRPPTQPRLLSAAHTASSPPPRVFHLTSLSIRNTGTVTATTDCASGRFILCGDLRR